MRFARVVLLVLATAVLSSAAVWWVLGSSYDYDLGRLNSVRPSTSTAPGSICVDDRYDENHCREGQPLILPAQPLAEGDCVEIRTRPRSRQVGVRAVNADACRSDRG